MWAKHKKIPVHLLIRGSKGKVKALSNRDEKKGMV